MVKGKARAAGSFLGGLANNPAIVIIALVLGGLFIFRDRISGALGSLGEGLGDINIQLPEIKLPEIKLPEIKFPEFNFPEFKFPELMLPDFSGLFGQGGITPPAQDPAGDPDLSIGLAGGIQQRRRDLERGLLERELEQADIPIRDIGDETAGLTPAQRFAFIERGVIPTGFQVVGGELVQEAAPSNLFNQGGLIADQKISSFLLDDPTQQFTGGGISFQGGSIFETPIQNLSLSQIIDKFMVTASQAANLKAIAQGFTPEEEAFLQGSGDVGGFFTGFNPPAVSDPQFQGLTPQQIALQLTGGNISNF